MCGAARTAQVFNEPGCEFPKYVQAQSCFVLAETFRSFLLRHFGLTVVLKLAITVFLAYIFKHSDRNDSSFFGHFQNISVYQKKQAQRYLCVRRSDWPVQSCDKGRWPLRRRSSSMQAMSKTECLRYWTKRRMHGWSETARRFCGAFVAEFGEALVYRIFVTEWMLNNLPFLWNSVRYRVPWSLTKHKRGKPEITTALVI